MRIKTDEVMKVAGLARLSLTEEEAQAYTREFDSILEHFAVIDEYDLSNDAVAIDVREKETPLLRKDIQEIFEKQDKLHHNVKMKKDGFIVVPKILE